MAAKKGFTLIEMVTVLFIIGVFAAMILPNLTTSMEQTKAQTAQNNLLAISAAESKYNEDYGYYCTNSAPNPSCGTSLSNLNSNLHLSMMTSDPFTYSCTSAPAPYECTASDGTVSLLTTGTGVSCTAGGSSCPFSN